MDMMSQAPQQDSMLLDFLIKPKVKSNLLETQELLLKAKS